MEKKKGKGAIKNGIGLLAIPLGVVVIVLGLAAPGFAHKTFDMMIAVCIIAAILVQAAGLKWKPKFMPLLSVIFYGASLGLVAYHSAPIVMDMINNLNFLDGNWTTVKVQLTLSVVICLVAVAACFTWEGGAGEDVTGVENVARKVQSDNMGNAVGEAQSDGAGNAGESKGGAV